MRTTFLGILLLCFGFVFGQKHSGQREVKVFYNNNQQQKSPEPTIIINNKIRTNYMGWINPSDIKELKVFNSKKDTIILGLKPPYILIYLKDSIQLNMISLTDIKKKYAKNISAYCIFRINGFFIKDKIEDCLINENNLFSINVDKIKSIDCETGMENEIDIIDILTDTKENVTKSKEIIRIRG